MRAQAPAAANGAVFEAARQLRQRQTPAEVHLWSYRRRSQLGVPFQRQHVIGRFVVDFCCPTALLVIEVDGDVHQATDVAEQDAWRARQLHDLGFHVMRISNDAVLYDTGAVIEQIQRRLATLV